MDLMREGLRSAVRTGVGISLGLLIVPCVLAQERAVVETEIQIEQIAPSVDDETAVGDDDALPAAGEDVPALDLNEKQMVIINQSLRNALEENKQLIDERKTLESELKELRGQSTIRRNRINNLIRQRDDLQAEIDALDDSRESTGKELEALNARMAGLEKELDDKIAELSALQKEKEKIKQMGLFWDPGDMEATDDRLKMAAERISFLSEENERLRAAAIEKQETVQRETDRRIAALKEENQELRRESLELLDKLEEEVQTTFEDMSDDVKTAAEKIRQLNAENQELRADSARLHYNLANLFYERGDYGRSVVEYKKVLEIMPNDAAAHYNLAFVSGEFLGDTETALKHYQEYLYLRPNAGDVDLVKEKILEAKLEMRSMIDSPTEKELDEEKAVIINAPFLTE